MDICLYTLGCKLNQAESRFLEEKLKEKGLSVVNWPAKAACYIINTCSVTAKVERKARQIISQIRREFPKSLILVTGCFVDKKNKLVDFWERDKSRLINLYQKIGKLKKRKVFY